MHHGKLKFLFHYLFKYNTLFNEFVFIITLASKMCTLLDSQTLFCTNVTKFPEINNVTTVIVKDSQYFNINSIPKTVDGAFFLNSSQSCYNLSRLGILTFPSCSYNLPNECPLLQNTNLYKILLIVSIVIILILWCVIHILIKVSTIKVCNFPTLSLNFIHLSQTSET